MEGGALGKDGRIAPKVVEVARDPGHVCVITRHQTQKEKIAIL